MRGKEWPGFSALPVWGKALVGLFFGIALMVLLLLPNHLAFYIMAAAAAAWFIGIWVAFRVVAGNIENRGTLTGLAWLATLATIVSMIAIGLIALILGRSWVLWFWTASESVGVIAWMLVVALRLEVPLQ